MPESDNEFDNFNPFEEVDAAIARADARAGMNMYGRPKPPLPEKKVSTPTMPTQKDFTPEQIEQFKSRYATDSIAALAKLLGVSTDSVYWWGRKFGLTRNKGIPRGPRVSKSAPRTQAISPTANPIKTDRQLPEVTRDKVQAMPASMPSSGLSIDQLLIDLTTHALKSKAKLKIAFIGIEAGE